MPDSPPSATTNDPVSATPATSVRRSLVRRLIGPLLVLVCLSCGVAGGTMGHTYLKPHEQPNSEEHEPTKEYVAPVVEFTPSSAVSQIDIWIRAGSFKEALALCKTAPRSGSADEHELAYRQAVCLEALGQLKEAAEAYKHSEPHEGDYAALGRALLGQARCAVAADDFSAAQSLVDRAALRAHHPDCAGTHIAEECMFLRTQCAAAQLNPVHTLDPFDPSAIAWPSLTGPLDKYHEWLSPNAPTTSAEAPEAQAHAPLPQVEAKDRAAVTRALQRVLTTSPEHPSAHAMRIWLGNFFFTEGKWREAAAEYQKVVDATPEVPELLYAYYNLGLTELRTGELRTARTRFVNLIDRSVKTKWVDYAWWWVGRTHLDTGNSLAAKQAWNKALQGETREVTSAAAIGVCACELLEGRDEAAKAVLEETRIDSREDHAMLAHYFEKLFRYRSSPSENRRTLLLDAMRDAHDGRKLGPGSVFLAGRVYRELDLPDHAAALYESAAASIRGPLAVQMTFDTAVWYELIEKTEPARERYLAVAAADPKGLGPKAQLRLAEIACRERNTDECLQRCRVLLNQKSVDRADVLAVMGRAYEQQRNYRLAAECFAGRIPEE